MTVNTLTLYLPGSTVGIQVNEGSQLHLILVSKGADSIPAEPAQVVPADPFPQYVDADELAEALAGAGHGDSLDAAQVRSIIADTLRAGPNASVTASGDTLVIDAAPPATAGISGDGVTAVRVMSLAQYEALSNREPTTLYVLPGAGTRLGSVDISTGSTTPEVPDEEPTPGLTVPQNLTGTTADRVVTLTWEPVQDATSYAVYEEHSGWTTPVAVVAEPPRVSGRLGISDPIYTYRVAARFSDGTESQQSTPFTIDISQGEIPVGDTTPPSTPTGLTATANGTTAVALAWSASSDNVAVVGYEVRRDGVPAASNVTGTSYTDTGLNPNTGYTFAVRAFDAAGNFSDWSADASATTAAVVTTPPPTGGGGELTVFTDTQIASLSTSSAPALRAKGIADSVKAGSAANNLKDVNNRVGPTALTTVLWWARTGDASYLAPAKAYILAAPKAPDGTQALNEWRGYGSLFAAVQILKRRGQWSDTASITGSYGGTWASFQTNLENRADATGNGRWSVLKTCAVDSANNWGAVARYALLMLAAMRGDSALQTLAANLFAKYLGEQVSGVADFNSTNDYLSSWDNWMPGNSNGASNKLKSGIGKRDSRLGLDGVVIDDIVRGGTGYSATVAYYGASGSGRTYPLEAADFAWASAAALLNAGYPVRAWGDQGFDRMNARFARQRVSGEPSLFEYTEGAYAVYRGGKWIAAKLSQADYGAGVATTGGEQGMSRALPYGDWIGGSGSTWGA